MFQKDPTATVTAALLDQPVAISAGVGESWVPAARGDSDLPQLHDPPDASNRRGA